MKGFGAHPNFLPHLEECWRRARRGETELILGEPARLSEFFNPEHPEIHIIPRDRFLNIEDDFGGCVCVPGMDRAVLPFSSTDFCIDEEIDGVFAEIMRTPSFHRLGGINQLGSLVTRGPERTADQEVYYLMPHFKHTRWAHSRLTAVLAEMVLARNGFSRESRTPFVLAAACHDIATPAGGDSIMRIDRQGLSEEENFSWLLQRDGLDRRWQEMFGFDLDQAAGWVKGQGVFGRLLDVIDKISYTLLDCFFIGMYLGPKSRLSRYARRNALAGDVWQAIRVSGETVHFTDPELLFQFLFLRALEHQELLLDPNCRMLDFTLSRKIKEFYAAGEITREWLIEKTDAALWTLLDSQGMNGIESLLQTPDRFEWRKFGLAEVEEEQEFLKAIGDRLYYREEIKPFKTGTNWLVESGNKVLPLKQVIPRGRIRHLESIAANCSGRFVYYYK